MINADDHDSAAIRGPNGFKCYRLQRSYLILGIVCSTGFLAMGVWTVWAAYWNIDGSFPHPKLMALIGSLFWMFWFFLGLWIILAYFRERLFISDSAIIQHLCFTTRAVDLADVTEIIWKRYPQGGRVIVRGPNVKVKVHLANFTSQEREELIQFFGGTFDEHMQKGWVRFVEAQRHRKRSISDVRSRAIVVWCIVFLLGFAGACMYVWMLSSMWYHLLIAVSFALAGAGYMWRAWAGWNRPSERTSA